MQLIITHELTKEKNYCASKSGYTNLFRRKRNIGNKGYSDQIITVFSCKLQGKRANKAKKLIRELIQEEADGKSHKSNVDTK